MGSLGLVHMNARVYDPTLGRFISADPTVSEPFSTQGLNRYAYVTNRPLDLTDPTGFEPIELQAVEVTGRRDLGFWGLEPGIWGMNGWRVPSVTRPAPVVGLLPLAGAGYAVDSALGTPEKVRQAGKGLQLIVDGLTEWYRTTPWGKLSEIASDAAKGLLTWAEGADRPPVNPNAPPPDNAYDPNGPKAPGRPGEDEGFKPPKGGDTWVKNPNGRGDGWRDKDGDVWVPTGPSNPSRSDAHGGPHWDVQTPGGGYVNVYPGGRRR